MSNAKRLVRSRTDKMVGGVCGGIGDYFEIDPTLVRIGFATLVLIGVGSPLLLYLLLWIIMPAADSPRALTAATVDMIPAERSEIQSGAEPSPDVAAAVASVETVPEKTVPVEEVSIESAPVADTTPEQAASGEPVAQM
jgi:phage shock protein C